MHRREPGRGARRVPLVEARVPAGEDARRLRDGSDADQAARLRPDEAAIRCSSSPTPARTRRRCANALGRHARTCITSCSRSRASSSGSATTARRAARARESAWAGLQAASASSELARHRGRRRVAEEAAVGRRDAHRHQRLELRRVHGGLRADAQQELRDGHRRRHRSPTGATTTRSTPSATC